jgi:phosphatidylglycerophosphate synthase
MASPYQYLCEERSIAHPFMKRFLWDPALRFIPATRSANTITLAGNVCSLLAFVFLALAPVTGVPDAAFVLPAAAIFLYLTLDNVDGAHARRTDSSSPFGEFLDHWLDAFNIGLLVLGYGLAMRMEPWLLLLSLALCQLAYFATLWEQRLTGWLRFGALGSIEGLLVLCFVYLLVAALGRDAVVGVPLLGPMTLSHIFAAAVCSSFAHIAITSAMRVNHSLRDFAPLSAFILLVALWYAFGRLDLVPAAFLVVLGGALLVGRNLIARLLEERHRGTDWVLLAGVALGAAGGAAGWGRAGDLAVAWSLVGYLSLRLGADFLVTTGRLSGHLRPGELLSAYYSRFR